MSNWEPNQQFKLVDGGETKWVKEKIPGQDKAYRHEVQQGPRGGEYFVGNDGVKRNAKAIPNKVEVWTVDQPNKAPEGIGNAGNARGQNQNRGENK